MNEGIQVDQRYQLAVRARTALRRTATLALPIALTAVLISCGEDPAGSEGGFSETRVTFDLSKSAQGIDACDQADQVTLRVTPAEKAERPVQSDQIGTAVGTCTQTFTVRVKPGDLDFEGEVLGGRRPLLKGAERNFPVRESGFVVDIELLPVDALDVRTQTNSLGGPPDYTLSIDGEPAGTIGATGAIKRASLRAGEHTVELSNLAPCAVAATSPSPNPATVDVPVPETQFGLADFVIECPDGAVEVEVVTAPGVIGPASYQTTVAPASGPSVSATLPRNGTHLFTNIAPGPATVSLAGFPACLVLPGASQSITVTSGTVTRVRFEVDCITITPGVLNVAVQVQDPMGNVFDSSKLFGVSLDGTSQGTVDDDAALVILPIVGLHDVTLSLVNHPSCDFVGLGSSVRSSTQSVFIDEGGNETLTFLVECPPPVPPTGNIQITTITKAAQPGLLDPDGYRILVDGVDVGGIGINTTVTITNVAIGSRMVELTGLDAPCAVFPDSPTNNPVTLQVNANQTTPHTFEVECGP